MEALASCTATLLDRPAPAAAAPVRATALLAVLALAGTVFAMMQALVIPALPRIQASLGVNADEAAWISTAYHAAAWISTAYHAPATCAGALVACATPRR